MPTSMFYIGNLQINEKDNRIKNNEKKGWNIMCYMVLVLILHTAAVFLVPSTITVYYMYSLTAKHNKQYS